MTFAPVPLDDWQRGFLTGLCDDYIAKTKKKIWPAKTPELATTLNNLVNSAVTIRNKLNGY